jgi:hypothetical protein
MRRDERKKIIHTYTIHVVCPHCGYEHHDLLDESDWDAGFGETFSTRWQECWGCHKGFRIERHMSYTYSTTPE